MSLYFFIRKFALGEITQYLLNNIKLTNKGKLWVKQ